MAAQVINRYRLNVGFLKVTFYADSEKLLGLEVGDSKHIKFDIPCLTKSNPVIDQAIDQFVEYVNGERKEFDLPIEAQGSEFEAKVFEELAKVGFGEVISYKELGEKAGKKDASRAVGNALADNKYPIILPCHRVVKADGSMGNYIGGEELKAQLIKFESENK